MVEILLLATIFISFFCALFVIPFWIRKARQENLVGKDMHKQNKNEVAEGGGVGVMFGFSIGVLLYLAINTFYFQRSEFLISIFAILTTLFIATMLGSIDDLLGWKKGLSKSMRIVMMLFAAIPLMVINAGESILFGIDFGLVYQLFLIPIGIVGASTTFNFLAGYNGLEESQGILLLSALSIVTFPVGALIAVIAILGNIEKIALFFFIPYILETILKLRGWLRKESFAKLNKDGSLEMPYGKIYGLEHLAIKLLKKIKPSKKVYEADVVYLINGFQIMIILLGFWIFIV